MLLPGLACAVSLPRYMSMHHVHDRKGNPGGGLSKCPCLDSSF